MKIRALFLIPLAATTLLAACSNTLTASSEEIISHVMQSEANPMSYYAESELKVYLNDELNEHASMAEYVHEDGRRKIVATDLLNEQTSSYALRERDRVILYEEGSETAHAIDLTDMGEYGGMTQKEQLTGMLERLKDTHSYEVAGEEELLGSKVYHLKVNAKEKDSLMGDMEFWVDQETWFLVRAVSVTGDIRTETSYSMLDFSPTFDETDFTLDLPPGVEIASMDEMMPSHTGTLEEAAAALGQPFLVLGDANLKEQQVEWHIYEGMLDRTEVNVSYWENELPVLTLTVFETPVDAELNGDLTIRGHQAEYISEIRMLSWDEDGLRYGILIDHPDLTPEEVVERAEDMILTDALSAAK
ncbi:LolA family protein [Paenibacillus sp. 1P07SE]|uniref:LolA family protein n=1 Tax=Paenibacillus sp. 1P07SE TaxID=3132209 RepID=UPI0039A470CD